MDDAAVRTSIAVATGSRRIIDPDSGGETRCVPRDIRDIDLLAPDACAVSMTSRFQVEGLPRNARVTAEHAE